MGDKSYELSNHLGNVLSVVSDRKTVTKDTKVFYDEHNQEHLWKPFGEVQEVFVNKENQWQITTTQANTGAFLGLSLEPNKTYSVSFNYLKKNGFSPNVLFKVVDGGDNEVVIKEQVLTQSEQIFTNFTPTIGDVKIYVLLQAESFEPVAEFALDNLLIYEINGTTNNDFATLFIPDVKSYTDYDPFGMLIPERFGQSLDYRYGFNGKEKDNELKGEGNSYDFGARMYDPRVGRWLSIDPLQARYPDLSPYNYVANNPIFYVDPDGKEIKPTKTFLASSYGGLYSSLMKDNSTYSSILSKYKSSKTFNFTLYFGDKNNSPGANATTASSKTITTTTQGKKVISKKITAVESNSYYGETPLTKTKEVVEDGKTMIVTMDRTDIAKVKTLFHEAIHANIATTFTDDDDAHNSYSKYQSMLLNGLKEYNTDNKLGFTDEQLTQLTWAGIHESKAFESYINGLVKANGTTYDEEYNKWNMAQTNLSWKEGKKEEKKEAPAATPDTNKH